MSRYYTIHDSELEKFKSICSKHDHEPSQFTIKEHDVTYTPLGDGLNHPDGKVTISKGSQSITITTGKRIDWLSEFEAALKKGHFA